MALPDWRMCSPVGVGQGRPAAHPHPAHHRPVEGDLPHPGRRRTRVGVLKHEWGMLPLRVRRLPRVRLHVDLTILARLASALIKARAVPLAA